MIDAPTHGKIGRVWQLRCRSAVQRADAKL